jgi:hypothetical protein
VGGAGMATAASEGGADRARWVEDGGVGHLWVEAVEGGARGALGRAGAAVGPLDRIALQRSCDTAKRPPAHFTYEAQTFCVEVE